MPKAIILLSITIIIDKNIIVNKFVCYAFFLLSMIIKLSIARWIMIDNNTSSHFLNDLAKQVAKILLPEVLEVINKQQYVAEDRTLDVEEAAKYIKISKVTLYRMCAEKLIPHMKIGGKGTRRSKLLFSSNSLDTWKKEEEQRNYQIKI